MPISMNFFDGQDSTSSCAQSATSFTGLSRKVHAATPNKAKLDTAQQRAELRATAERTYCRGTRTSTDGDRAGRHE